MSTQNKISDNDLQNDFIDNSLKDDEVIELNKSIKSGTLGVLGSNERIVIGASGGEYLKDLLGKSTNPPETIHEFQKMYGIARLNPTYQSSLQLLDLLGGGKRSDLYFSLLDSLIKQLLLRIENNMNQEQLQKLLISTFTYVEFPELRCIPFAILSKQEQTPDIFLKKLTENSHIMEELPLHVKRRVWLVDDDELDNFMGKSINQYIKERERCAVLGFDMMNQFSSTPDKQRKTDMTLHSLKESIGNDTKLFQCCLQSIQHQIERIPKKYLHYLCTFRSDFINFQKDHTTSLLRADKLHKLAWSLDNMIKQNQLGPNQLMEILTCIQSYYKEDLPASDESDSDEDNIIPTKAKQKDDTKEDKKNEVEEIKPTKDILLSLLTKFEKIDHQSIFALPVPLSVPGYHEIIEYPMDLSTMKNKAVKGKYLTMQEFRDDLNLMIDNCSIFNDESTIFYKEGKRLGKLGNHAIDKKEKQMKHFNDPTPSKKRKIENTTEYDPNLSGISREGVYESDILDIALLLGSPYMYHLIIQTLNKTLLECVSHGNLPAENLMIRGLCQLLQLGGIETILNMAKTKNYQLKRPETVLLRVFLPLLARTMIMNGKQYLHFDLHQDSPTTDSTWKEVFKENTVAKKITQYYIIQSINFDVVNVYRNLLNHLSEYHEEMIQDRCFVQSFVSALKAHKGLLSMHLRNIAIDEFLVPFIIKGNKQEKEPEQIIPIPMLHTQFARLLADFAGNVNCNISPPDIQEYAQDALTGICDTNELPIIWEMDAFQEIKNHYEQLFVNFPGVRRELGLPTSTLQQ